MSYTELKFAPLNGPVENYIDYHNSWGGFAYIWDSIWEKYLKRHMYDSWLTHSERLWDSINNLSIPNWVKLILASTFDDAIIEYDKLPVMSKYYDDFIKLFPYEKRKCHLPEWSKMCLEIYKDYNSNNCAGICFYSTSVNEDPWKDYDLSKGDKHWFVFERYSEMLELQIV